MNEYQSPYQSQDITKLAKALIHVQTGLRPAHKDAENPFTKSNYATLNSVMESCREALLSQGIWMTQYPVPAPEHLGGGYLGLMTKLTHAESGQWQSSFAVVPLPKNDPQGMGIAMTYTRRYALCAMLGIVTEDDDGEGAKHPTKPSGRSKANLPVSSTPPASPAPETRNPAPSQPPTPAIPHHHNRQHPQRTTHPQTYPALTASAISKSPHKTGGCALSPQAKPNLKNNYSWGQALSGTLNASCGGDMRTHPKLLHPNTMRSRSLHGGRLCLLWRSYVTRFSITIRR